MSCPSVDRLYDDLDGALTGAEKEAVERHLQSCESCRRARAVRGRIAGAAADLPPFEVPPDFAAGVMAGIAALPVPAAKKLHPGLVWTAAVAAAAGAGIGLGMILAGAGSAAWLSRIGPAFGAQLRNAAAFAAKGGKLLFLGGKIILGVSRGVLEFLRSTAEILGPDGRAVLIGGTLVILISGGVFLRRRLPVSERTHEK